MPGFLNEEIKKKDEKEMMIPEALNIIPGLWDFASRLRSDLIN